MLSLEAAVSSCKCNNNNDKGLIITLLLYPKCTSKFRNGYNLCQYQQYTLQLQ